MSRALLTCPRCYEGALPGLPGDAEFADKGGGVGTLLACSHVDPTTHEPCSGSVLSGPSVPARAIAQMAANGMNGYSPDDQLAVWHARNLREMDLS